MESSSRQDSGLMKIKYPTLLAQLDESIPEAQIGTYRLKLELEVLTPFGQEVAERELRETLTARREATHELRRLLQIEETEGLIVPFNNDYWLIRFLRPCKFYPASALALIKRHYKFKVKYPEVYESLLPSTAKALLDPNIFTPLPNRDQLGRRMLVCKGGKSWNYNEVTILEMVQGVVVCVEMCLTEEETQVHGALIIFDLDGFTLRHLWQYTIAIAKMFTILIQECIPLRVKAVHFVNHNPLFSIAFNIFIPFLSKKFVQRIHLHGRNMASLHTHVSPDCLPQEYGGTMNLSCFSREMRYSFWKQLDKEFEALNQYGYNIRNS